MKIMKVKSRNYKEKQYYKYRINIPETKLIEANFKEGDDLIMEVKQNKVILSKKQMNK